MPDLPQSTRSLKTEARRLGFEVSGCAPAHRPGTFKQFQSWLQQDFHGEMEYMRTREQAYSDPDFVMENSVSVMMLARHRERAFGTRRALRVGTNGLPRFDPQTAEGTLPIREDCFPRRENARRSRHRAAS